MTIRLNYAGRRVIVRVPEGQDDVVVEILPPGNGDNGNKNSKPLVILTDR